jgi:hypothetical protein
VSFDVNYRAARWSTERAAPVLSRIAAAVDLIFAGPEEAELILGWEPTAGTATVGGAAAARHPDQHQIARGGRHSGDRRGRPQPSHHESPGPLATCRPAPGGRCAAPVSRRRALSRDQPVTDVTSSRMRPFVRLSAALNALADLVVTSARDIIDNPLLMPHDARRYAGIPT